MKDTSSTLNSKFERMKLFIRYIKYTGLLLGIMIFFQACEEDEPLAPVPTALFTISSENVVVGEYITLQNQTKNATAFEWSLGNGVVSSAQSPEFSYDRVGNYKINMIAIGPGGREKSSLEVQVSNPDVFYMDSNEEALQKLIYFDTIETVFMLPAQGRGISYDPRDEKIYYTDEENGVIITSNLDSSATSKVVVPDFFLETYTVEVDTLNDKLYFADTYGYLYRSNLDGSQIEELANPDDGLEFPTDVALDLVNGKIYISDIGIRSTGYAADGIWVANLDGSGIEKIITGGGFAVAVDSRNSFLYYNDAYIKGNLRQVSLNNYDDISDFAPLGSEGRSYGIEVFGSKVYWTDLGDDIGLGLIKRANWDGTGVEVLVEELTEPRHLIVKK